MSEEIHGIKEPEQYRYLDNEVWAMMVMLAGLEMEYDEEGEQWIFEDYGHGNDYGQGETPQEAIDDYVKSVRERVMIEQDYIRDMLDEDTIVKEYPKEG